MLLCFFGLYVLTVVGLYRPWGVRAWWRHWRERPVEPVIEALPAGFCTVVFAAWQQSWWWSLGGLLVLICVLCYLPPAVRQRFP